MSRPHRGDPDRHCCRGGGGSDPPEHGVAGLVGNEHREWREHARLVQDDLGGIDERDLCDEREEPVPERERVAGMEPAVCELVHRRQREVAELPELPDAGEVEEPVTSDLPCDRPEQNPDDRTGEPDTRTTRKHRHRPTPDRERRHDEGSDSQQHERQREGAVDREGHSESAEDEREAAGERRRRAPHAQSSCHDRARGENEPGCGGKPHEQEQRAHRAISERTSPVPSHRAASRYIAPC